jgi:hypothetical protein
MDAYRISALYDIPVTPSDVLHSVIGVNGLLVSLKRACIALGHTTLADYASAHSEQIDGEELLLALYKKAVFCYAKAILIQQFETINPIREDKPGQHDGRSTYETRLREADSALASMLLRLSVVVGNGSLDGFYDGRLWSSLDTRQALGDRQE